MNERIIEQRVTDIEAQMGTWSDGGLRTLDQIPQAFPFAVKAVTTTYTVEPFIRLVLANATSGAFTVTLPNAYGRMGQQPIYVKRTNGGGNAVTVAAASGNVEGGASYSLGSQYAVKGFVSDNTDWWALS